MEKFFNWINKLDKRIIYIFIFLAVLIPFLIKFEMPIKATGIVKSVYDKINEVADKKGIALLSFDFDPASKAELEPVARAMVDYMFSKGIRIVEMGTWPNGVGLAKKIMTESAEKYHKEYGKDWVFYGYAVGGYVIILNMGENFLNAWPKDADGKNTKDLEAMKGINSLKDFDYVFSLSAGSSGVDIWVVYGQQKFKFVLGGAATAVMAPDFYPYLQAGQLNGLIGGLTGAAQFESLVNMPGRAIDGMRPQSVAHIVLIFFIILGNIIFFYTRRANKKRGA